MKFKLFGFDFEFPAFNIPLFLAISTTMGFFALLGDILFREIPSGSKDISFTMLGAVATAWGSLIQYFFGSSAGSARKTDMLATTGTSTTTTTADTKTETIVQPGKKDDES